MGELTGLNSGIYCIFEENNIKAVRKCLQYVCWTSKYIHTYVDITINEMGTKNGNVGLHHSTRPHIDWFRIRFFAKDFWREVTWSPCESYTIIDFQNYDKYLLKINHIPGIKNQKKPNGLIKNYLLNEKNADLIRNRHHLLCW